MHRQHTYVVGGMHPGAALVVVRLAVIALQPHSTVPAVAVCRLVGCNVVSGLPLRSCAVAGVVIFSALFLFLLHNHFITEFF